MDKYTETDFALARLLCDFVLSGKYKTTYKECSVILTQRLNRNVHYRRLGTPLERVCNMCRGLGLPLITVIVHHSYESKDKVGVGLYNMAKRFYDDCDTMDESAIYYREMERIMNCQNWDLLDKYLKKYYK